VVDLLVGGVNLVLDSGLFVWGFCLRKRDKGSGINNQQYNLYL
jgi:hypothetical protein